MLCPPLSHLAPPDFDYNMRLRPANTCRRRQSLCKAGLRRAGLRLPPLTGECSRGWEVFQVVPVWFSWACLLFAVTTCSRTLPCLCAGNPLGLLTRHEVGCGTIGLGTRRRVSVTIGACVGASWRSERVKGGRRNHCSAVAGVLFVYTTAEVIHRSTGAASRDASCCTSRNASKV